MPITPTSLIENIDEVAEAIDRAADDERTPEVAEAVKRHIPTNARRAVYTVGAVLGVVATAGAILAASLEGQPALLVAGVSSVALAVSSLIAKSHIAD
jgi:hypothetical protein